MKMRGKGLVDLFGRNHNYLRISLTEKCNLRCTYCMPEEGVQLTPSESLLSRDEILRLTGIFVDNGVTKIRFTGGEPLVRGDAVEIVKGVDALRDRGLEAIGMTSNGIVLKRKLAPLIDAGLNNLNISLDTLDPFKFQLITRRNGLTKVLEAIDIASESNLDNVKVNCVLMRGVNDEEILDFVEFTRDRNVEVRFIEYMPFDGNKWKDTKMVPYKEILCRIRNIHPTLAASVPAGPNETSKVFQVPGFRGSVGIISSMTNHFCYSCNRVRLTADGHLKVCLFGASEVNLKDCLRSGGTDQDILQVIQDAVLRKKKKHAGMYEIQKFAQQNRPMITIGG